MVPQEAYPGNAQGDSLPVHGELDAVLKGYVDQVIRKRNGSLTPGRGVYTPAFLNEVRTFFEGGRRLTRLI